MVTPLYEIYHSGGLAHSCRRIAKGFSEKGHQVHVVNIDAEIQYWDDIKIPKGLFTIKDGDINLHHLPEKYSYTGIDLKKGDEIDVKLIQWYLYFKDFVKKHNPDVVISFYITPYGYPASLISKEFKIPFISAIRGNDIGRFIHSPEMIPLIKHILENSDKVITLSKDLEKQVKLLVPKAKVEVIYNSVDPNLYHQKYQEVGSNKKIIVGSTGIFKPKKGIEVLIRSFNLKSFNNESELLLVGDFSKSLTKKENYKYNKLKNKLIITGIVKREKVIEYLKNMDIYVTLTNSDGCPNSVLEAMCLGRAILTTPVAAMPDILKDGKSAIFIDTMDENLILEKLEYMMQNRDLLKKLGKNARLAAKKLLPPYEINSWLKVIKKIK